MVLAFFFRNLLLHSQTYLNFAKNASSKRNGKFSVAKNGVCDITVANSEFELLQIYISIGMRTCSQYQNLREYCLLKYLKTEYLSRYNSHADVRHLQSNSFFR